MHSICTEKTFKEELEQFQKQDIITPLDMDETLEWCNSFVLLPNPNGEIKLCLDLGRINQVLIRPVQGGPTCNDIYPELNNIQHHSLIDVSSGYHHLKLDERSSYLTTFTCQIGRFRYKTLLFGAASAGYMFPRKRDEVFKIYLMYLVS